MDHSDDDERFMAVVASVDRDICFKVGCQTFIVPNLAIDREDSHLRRMVRDGKGCMVRPDSNFGSAVYFDADPRRFAAVAHFYITDELDLDNYSVYELEAIAIQYDAQSMRALCEALINSTKASEFDADAKGLIVDEQRPGPSGLAKTQRNPAAKKGLPNKVLKDLEAAGLPRLFHPPSSEPSGTARPDPVQPPRVRPLNAADTLGAFRPSAWNALHRAIRRAPLPTELMRFPPPVVRMSRLDVSHGALSLVFKKPSPWVLRAEERDEKKRR